MTIETKHNIGDEVWIEMWVIADGKKYKKVRVFGVTVNVRTNGDIIIEYALTRSGYYYARNEDAIFPTKEELLKSL